MLFDILMVERYNLDVKRNTGNSERGIVMGTSRQEAAETRKRIVTAASMEFRKHGVVATGLNDLMAAAGFTRGGFYKHFDVRLLSSFRKLLTSPYGHRFRSNQGGCLTARLRATAASYLSTAHRDNPSDGCPFSAIASELPRCPHRSIRRTNPPMECSPFHRRLSGATR